MDIKFHIFNKFPSYFKYGYVEWDESILGEDEEIIGTDGVSSCLAITLYDPTRKIGTLAHITGRGSSPREMKPENIIDTQLNQLRRFGDLDYQKLEASLAGEKFKSYGKYSLIVKSKLKEYNIPIIGEDLGDKEDYSFYGRLIFLHCNSGKVEVYRQ